MRKDKLTAVALRMQGKSYKEIAHLTKIPKSTLFEWFHAEGWSQKIKERLNVLNGRRGANALQQYRIEANRLIKKTKARARKEAREEYSELRNNPLFVAGIMLYWGEGDKSINYGQVRLSNCDEGLLKVFLGFLRITCKVPEERIKAWVLIYPDLDSDTCLTSWRKNLRMSCSQFIKPTTIRGRHPTKRLTYGVCTIYTSFSMLKVKILEWIKLSAGIV